MTIKVSVFWPVSLFSPVKSPTPRASEVPGQPVMDRISLSERIPDRTEDSFSRNRIVCSIVRLLRTGMPLKAVPARLRMSNSSCKVTSSSSCNRGVAFSFNPRSSYSEDGYAVCAGLEAPAADSRVLSVTLIVFVVSFATSARCPTCRRRSSPLRPRRQVRSLLPEKRGRGMSRLRCRPADPYYLPSGPR